MSAKKIFFALVRKRLTLCTHMRAKKYKVSTNEILAEITSVGVKKVFKIESLIYRFYILKTCKQSLFNFVKKKHSGKQN